MVIPFSAPEVAHLVHQSFELVVHSLWVFSFVEHKTTELPFDRFPLGDLGHLVSFVCDLEHVSNLFGALQPLHLVILLSTYRGEEYSGSLGVEVPDLGNFVRIIVFIPCDGTCTPISTTSQMLVWSEVR
jgi:hypothetical protein